MTSATNGTGTDYPSGATEHNPDFSGVRFVHTGRYAQKSNTFIYFLMNMIPKGGVI
jgi:hypothetical protein